MLQQYGGERMTRWIVIAAVTGECCPRPHAFYRYVRCKSSNDWGKDVMVQEKRFKQALERRGFDVGEVFAVRAVPTAAWRRAELKRDRARRAVPESDHFLAR